VSVAALCGADGASWFGRLDGRHVLTRRVFETVRLLACMPGRALCGFFDGGRVLGPSS